VKTHNVSRRSGTMGFTPDGLPLVGQLPDLPQVYFAVGFGGRGLAWAFVAAERLVEEFQISSYHGSVLMVDLETIVGIYALHVLHG